MNAVNCNTLATTALASLSAASKCYGNLQALYPLDLQVRRGEVLALLGPNGAGKTTALGLLTGRISPDQGQARLLGQDPRDWQARRQIGVMLQEGALPDTLRVAEHIRLFSGYYPNPRPVEETLALCGLQELAQRRYEALSGGQKRRVQFALAVCGQPPLLFVDEPTTGLDVDARRGFWKVLSGLRDSGTSIVLTTHYLEEADALADRIVLLSEGRLLAEDTPAGIKTRASGKRLRCHSRLPLAQVQSWPEVESASSEGEHLEMRSRQPEDLLRRLLAADPTLAEIEVQALSLEDAFLSLTATRTATESRCKEAA